MLDRYKRIKAILEDSSTLAYLNFIVYLSSCVTPFLTFFQKEDPLVHVLYDGLNGLVRSLMLKFLKTESVLIKLWKNGQLNTHPRLTFVNIGSTFPR